MTRLSISRKEWSRLVGTCNRRLPEEACGLIGCIERSDQMLLRAYPVENLYHSPIAFRISRSQIARTKQLMSRRGEKLWGIYHSHPMSLPALSTVDLRSASMPQLRGLSWIVYSPLFRTAHVYSHTDSNDLRRVRLALVRND